MTDSDQSAITRSQIRTLKALSAVILLLIATTAGAVYGVTATQIAGVRQECVERIDEAKEGLISRIVRESERGDRLLQRLLDCEARLASCYARPAEFGAYTIEEGWSLTAPGDGDNSP